MDDDGKGTEIPQEKSKNNLTIWFPKQQARSVPKFFPRILEESYTLFEKNRIKPWVPSFTDQPGRRRTILPKYKYLKKHVCLNVIIYTYVYTFFVNPTGCSLLQAGYETWLFVRRCQGAKESWTSQLPRSWNAPVAPGPPSTLRWNKAQQPQNVKPCHPGVHQTCPHIQWLRCCMYMCMYLNIYIYTYKCTYIYILFMWSGVQQQQSNQNDDWHML